MSSKRMRDLFRIGHLIEGVMIILFVYSADLRAIPLFAGIVQWVIVPLIVLSGLLLWQMPRLNKWRSQSRRLEMPARI